MIVLLKIFYDLWIPVVKTLDFARAGLLFFGIRGRSQFKGIFSLKKLVKVDFCLADLLSFTLVTFSMALDLKTRWLPGELWN